ncbi:MAG: cysteine desulfurase / selenocysteine lyase [Acidobacteriaceae bacterium]|nr:cysteine desulfurase / selenocysteine lyase [Acidobacteriaceae bacterium]
MPVDETTITPMGSLPDIAMLTRLANEFFRAQPGQGFPTSVVPYTPDVKDVTKDMTPAFETRLPEVGMPLPSVPAIPSAGGFPLAPNASQLSTGVPELAPFTMGPAAAVSLPAAFPPPMTAPVPEVGMLQGVPRGVPQNDPRSAGAGLPVSPFAMPMPEFGAPFPSFEAGVPVLPPLSPLLTEDAAKSALTTTSPFYFLENAGGLNGLGMSSMAGPSAVANVSQYEPRSTAAVMPSSPFSVPMPEFDRAFFPSFEDGVPKLAPLPPLRNENDARAALTDPSSFYFLDERSLMDVSAPQGSNLISRPGMVGGMVEGAIGDLKLPRQQMDIGSVRRDFPILHEQVNGHPLIWLDNAATTQKPQSVIDRISYFYEHENSNIHRAAHELAARATDAYEDARTKVAHFLNASSSKEIVFVRGATEAINLVAQAWGRRHINKGDEIVITWIEHHANIVPWQMLCAEKGACLRVAPVDNDGQILLDEYEKLLSPKTRLVSFTQVSNALGTVTPAHQMVQMAHRYGARVLLDGAQAVSHMPIDVQSLDCDFYVFSGHKVFAPTGIGVLYGKPDVLAETPPWQGGGNMIVDVTFEKTTYQPPPGRFEAGTGNIADAVGLGAAIDYLEHIGMPNIARYEHELLVYATQEMLRVPGLRMIGTAKEKAGVLSFVLEGFRTEEVGAALNREGIAVRSGHHCAQPTLRRFGLETTVRPSLALYNSFEDIDALVAALFRLKRQGV